jgi:hypothetical protein
MKTKVLIITLFVLLPNIVLADIKYNPYNGQWESAPSDSSLKHNPYNGNWSHERTDSNLEYNPYTSQWDYER